MGKFPVGVFDAAQELASVLRRDVDLIDLRRASDVMRVQVYGKGSVIYDPDGMALGLKARAYKDYALLNEERAAIIAGIKERYP